MQEKGVEQSFATWYSTYGFLTVERILEYLNIKLPHDKLVAVLKEANHVFHLVLHVPMLNIFNGIILQQAYDYQVYAQKLIIDYRLSPEFGKDPELPGANIRNDLSVQFEELSSAVKMFSDYQYDHYRLISESQAYLIERVGQLNDPLGELDILNDDSEFKSNIKLYTQKAEEMTITFRSYRSQFYEMILSITERLMNLPEYTFDAEEASRQRESLFFDREIGGQ